MSTKALAAAETAEGSQPLQTVGEALDRQVRDDVLRGFAQQVLGTEAKPDGEAAEAEAGGRRSEIGAKPKPESPPPEEADAEKTEVLSQVEDGKATAEAGAEPAETTTETKADDAPETAAAEDEDHLGDELRGRLDDNTQQAVNRRIGKEVAKTKAKGEAIAKLEAEVAELKAKVTEPGKPEPVTITVKPIPLAHVNDSASLQAETGKAEAALEQSEDLLASLEDTPEQVETALKAAGLKLTDERGDEDYSVPKMRQALRAIHKNADRTLRKDIPARVEFLKEADALAAEVVKLMPELKDKTSARYAKFQTVLKERPEVRNYANWPVEAAARVLGWEALEAMQAKAAAPVKPAVKRAVPVTIPKPTATASAPRSRQLSTDVEERALNGDKNARQEYIRSILPKIPGM